ncbi:MAG: SDR family NAD(P)-dependent oxidoreductase [Planctomycetia bacterium]|jgi:NAD(P)-dependent dehydrogenase (short-subunit alcohol dehydrogenase family)
MKNSIFDLTGKCALVTGGSRGLGKAMTRLFAEAGADVFICSRKEEELKPTAEEIREATGRRIEYAVVDMTDREQLKSLPREAIGRLGKIDILVNNAGFNITSPIDRIKDEDFDMLTELNLRSVMALTRSLVPCMKERRWGRVIHISSIMGLASTEARNAYSATKAALIGMAKASALDLGPFGITVNCIAPGPFATEMPMSILSQEQQDKLAARTAVGRWGRPEELAGTALLLASDAGAYITGTTIVVDGGTLARVF